MTQECQHCGKTRFQFDHAWDNPRCLRPEISDPAVGGWVCTYKPAPLVDGVPQTAVIREVVLRCPMCREVHTPESFKDGKKHCSGCGNTITNVDNQN